MLLSNQQKYILEILKEFKYLRVRQLYALVQAHYRTQGIKIDERRMEIMLRQMRTGTNYVWLRGDVVSYGDRRIDPRLLEALDVMLELTKAQPGFYSKDGLHEPFLLRFTGNGKGAGYLFSVAWLDAAIHSHNSMDAFFSGKDDQDERSTGLYLVLGKLDKFYPDIKARIFCGDSFVSIDPNIVMEGLEQPFPKEWLTQVSIRSRKSERFKKPDKRSFRDFLEEAFL